MPVLRTLEVMQLLGELSAGPIDRAYLAAITKGLEDALQTNKILNAAQIVADLKTRLVFNTSKRHILSVCAAIYLDPDESPSEHNYDRATEKVNRWIKDGVDTFFLSKPLGQLLPEWPSSQQAFQSYLEKALPEDQEIKSLQSLLALLSGNESASPALLLLTQRIATLQSMLS